MGLWLTGLCKFADCWADHPAALGPPIDLSNLGKKGANLEGF